MIAPKRRPYHLALLDRARALKPMRTGIVHPCDSASLESAISAAELGVIEPVLIGNASKIRSVAEAHGLDVGAYELVGAAHSHEAAATGAALARSGAVAALMKGSLHSDEFLHEITRPDSGLHTERRISHAYVMDVRAYRSPLLISDAVVNINPTLDEKRDIVANAVDLARALDVGEVRVAVLSAIESVSSRIQSTLDAAALSKMADRGEFRGAWIDGPLALDDAIAPEAALEKGIVSPVAGRANVLIVPNFESGNMLAKALILLAEADAAGVVLGARVPLVLASRADSVMTRVASTAVARLLQGPMA